MKHPRAGKNPFLSMWLSGANAVAGAARGRASAEAKRQAAAAMTRGTKQMQQLWADALFPPPARRRRKAR